jgi:hypothetical protein
MMRQLANACDHCKEGFKDGEIIVADDTGKYYHRVIVGCLEPEETVMDCLNTYLFTTKGMILGPTGVYYHGKVYTLEDVLQASPSNLMISYTSDRKGHQLNGDLMYITGLIRSNKPTRQHTTGFKV